MCIRDRRRRRERRGGVGAWRSISQLPPVALAVLATLLEHVGDVGPRFVERDRLDPQRDPTPALGLGRARVVGGERGDLVAVELRQQLPQVEGAVADVDVGVGEIGRPEIGAAAAVLDLVGGFRRHLHQPARAGTRGLVAEARLGIDHGRDQRGVDLLFVGLLADDVLVAQGQGELLDHVVEAAEDADREPGGKAERHRHATGEQAPPPPRLALHRRSFSTSADSSRSSCSRLPSLATPCSARAAFSSWASWRASRSPTRAWPRASARSRRTLSAAVTATVVSKTPSIPDSNSSGTSTTATSVSSGSDPSQAPIRSPTRGWICASSHFSSSGSAKTIPPIRSRSTEPPGATPSPVSY